MNKFRTLGARVAGPTVITLAVFALSAPVKWFHVLGVFGL